MVTYKLDTQKVSGCGMLCSMLCKTYLGSHQRIYCASLDHSFECDLFMQVVGTLHSQPLSLTPKIGHRKKLKLDSNHRYSPDICTNNSNITD